MNTVKFRAARLYAATGISAIIAGGVLSAFTAKYPSTVVMWTSAYLVLVVGVVQVFFGEVIERLMRNRSTRPAYVAFGLFNSGNVLVVAGTVAKYAGNEWNMMLTIAGSIFFVAALTLLGWHIRAVKRTYLKTWAFVIMTALALSALVGIGLARG